MVIFSCHLSIFFICFIFIPPQSLRNYKKINQYLCNIYYEFRTMLGKVIYNTEPAPKRYSVVETRVTEVVKKKNQ